MSTAAETVLEPLEGLEKALLVPDKDGLVYLVCPTASLVLVYSEPEKFFDEDILALIRAMGGARKYLKYAVLHASNIDFDNEMFLPYDGFQHESLWSDFSYAYDFLTPGRVLSLIQANEKMLEVPVFSLTKRLERGKARSLYQDAASKRSKQASAYIFETPTKVLKVDGPLLRTLHSLGFTALYPKEFMPDLSDSGSYASHNDLRPKLVLKYDNDLTAFGFLDLQMDSGVMESRDGRKLYIDAAKLSWINPAKVIEGAIDAALHPIMDREKFNHNIWWLATERVPQAQTFISALRWYGYTDDEIEDIHSGSREESLRLQHASLVSRAQATLEGYLEAVEVSDWWVESKLREALSMKVKHERICSVLGEDLSSGYLPELIEQLEDP